MKRKSVYQKMMKKVFSVLFVLPLCFGLMSFNLQAGQEMASDDIYSAVDEHGKSSVTRIAALQVDCLTAHIDNIERPFPILKPRVVEITGENFGDTKGRVHWKKGESDGYLWDSEVFLWSDTEIRARIPLSISLCNGVEITIEPADVAAQCYSNPFPFTAPICIGDDSDLEGSPQQQITIRGEGFGTDPDKVIVKFCNQDDECVEGEIVSVTDTEIVVIVPDGLYGGYINVYIDNGDTIERAIRRFTVTDGIAVTSPQGGENWTIGSTMPIEWSSSGVTGNVIIKLGRPSGCGGYSWSDVINSTSNVGIYDWTVEGPAKDNCIIKITSVNDPTISDESELFDIVVKRILISITQAIGNGAVSIDGSFYTLPWSGEFNENDSVTLEALPDSFDDWKFYGWYGDLTGSTNPTTITMDSDKNITAIFYHQGNNILIIEKIGNGTIEVDGTGISTFPYFDEFSASSLVSLNAVPDSGWAFSGWTGDQTGSTNPTDINMDSDKNITANFETSFSGLCTNPTSFSFTATEGGPNPVNQTLSILNCGDPGSTLNWQINENIDWLFLSPTSGSLTEGETVYVTVSVINISDLTEGEYQGDFNIVDIDSGTTMSATVTLTINRNLPNLCVTPATLDLTTYECGSHTASGQFTVENCGGETLDWSVTVPPNVTIWLSIFPDSGTLGAGQTTTVFVFVDTSSLGQFASASANINITSDNGNYGDSTVAINVTNVSNDAPQISSVRFGSPIDDDIGGSEPVDNREEFWITCNATDSDGIASYEFVGYSPSGTPYEKVQSSDRWYFRNEVVQEEIEIGAWDFACQATDVCGKPSGWVWGDNFLHVGAYYYDVDVTWDGGQTQNEEPRIGPGQTIRYCIADPKPISPINRAMTFDWSKTGAGNGRSEFDKDENFCFTYTAANPVPNYEVGRHQLDVEGIDPTYCYCGEYAGFYDCCGGDPRRRFYFRVYNY